MPRSNTDRKFSVSMPSNPHVKASLVMLAAIAILSLVIFLSIITNGLFLIGIFALFILGMFYLVIYDAVTGNF